MKKAILWTLLLALLLPAAVAEEALPRASALVNIDAFSRYPSFQMDETTGKWRVRTNQADALLERFWDSSNEYAGNLCVFTLELEGNAFSGIWSPVLRFYYMSGRTALNANAVSLLLGDTRYDFAAQSSVVGRGNRSAECVSVPLTEDALTAVELLSHSTSSSVRLMGDRVHTTTLDPAVSNPRRQLEAASLEGIKPALALLREAGLDAYHLWDLSAAAWQAEYGFAPVFVGSPIATQLNGNAIDDDFGMVLAGNRTEAAQAAQAVLIQAGFLSGSPARTFDDQAVQATRRAQRYLGQIETGAMDARLAALLSAVSPADVQADPATRRLGKRAEIALDRYWMANAFSPENAPSVLRASSNADNVLLVADGWIRNVSGMELRLFMQVTARLLYGDDCAYEATLLCERDGGRDLDTAMIPLAQSRLILYAEIPAYLATDGSAQWRIEISTDGETLSFPLE